jgi:serine/threonine-protein kinase RIO1
MYCEEQSQVSYQTTDEYFKFLTAELAKGDLSDFQVLYLKGEKLAVEKQIKTLK